MTATAEETTYDQGQAHRDRMAKRSRELAAQAAEIGPPPERDDELWERYRYDLFAYLTERFPHSTGLKPFSLDHKRVIGRMQQSILEGGLELLIVFRGWAKSTIAELAATWATGYGHRKFFVPVGADHGAASMALESIQAEFETNDLLMEIFPAVCHCARSLEGVPQRAGKQTIDGQLTYIEWTKEKCVFPTIEGFEGSGAIIWPKGITANMRGMRFKRPDGEQARPDFVFIDDPQTDDSAASPTQVKKRLRTLNNSILRLGGHSSQIACVVCATIIEPDDMIDQLQNPKLYPAWRTSKTPMLKSFAKAHDTLWLDKYATLRGNYDPEDDDSKLAAHKEATAFYLANRDDMDDGAEASWEHCYNNTEVSAIQHAYNILIDTTYDAFMAECQNDPVRNTGGLDMLTPREICQKQSGYARNTMPAECTTLTAFVDVHPSALYYAVWAWEPNFTGYCIDYGTFPEQSRVYFAHSDISRTLRDVFPHCDVDSITTLALDTLLHGDGEKHVGLLQKEWARTDGVPLKLAKCGIDASGEPADAIKKFIRQSPFSSILYPSFGTGVGAKMTPLSRRSYAKERPCNWPEAVTVKGRVGEPVGYLVDTNYAKTRFHRALALPSGSKGSLYLFKESVPNQHLLVSDHWSAETPTEVTVGSRTIYEWSIKPNSDNHLFDCATGCMVAAGLAGIASVRKPQPKPAMTLREMAEAARRRR